MERYLLHDNGCDLCTQLATSIESETRGWLTTRSLNDPVICQILDEARPDWQWEPTLLEITPRRTRVFTGLMLRVRLLIGLGPVRAWRVARLVQRSGVPMIALSYGRRQFMQQASTILALLPLGLWRSSNLLPLASSPVREKESHTKGESYAGFLLLPEGTPVSSDVIYPPLGMPAICGAGHKHKSLIPKAITREFKAVDDLVGAVPIPIYELNHLPEGLQSAGATLIQYGNGENFATSVDYKSWNTERDDWETTVSIWAYSQFPKPFPLWYSEPVEPGGPSVVLEKTDRLPTPGIMMSSSRGHVFHWIQGNFLYTLIAEHSPVRETATELATLLTHN